jgi:ferric-dicitrate binding protein FerR (iron transport regulator)
MSRGLHIAPHRLADAASGRLSARELARIDRHTVGCPRCASARERLVRAQAAMSDIADQPAPELGWDHIGVRVYWSTSSARHAALRERDRSWWRQGPLLGALSALGLAAAAGFALTLWSSQGDWPGSSSPIGASYPAATVPSAESPAEAPREVAPPPAATAAAPLRGVVTFASGEVSIGGAQPRAADGDAVAALFSSAIVQGVQLRTGEGRLVVQFGAGSGLALPPHSSARLSRFDERVVEVSIDEGTVEFEVARRRMDQSLTVVAGRHRVSVLGTAFRVAHRGGDFDVQCARGQVVVSDGSSEVAVSAGEQLKVLQQSLLARALRQAIDRQRLAALERDLARPLLPAWTESRALFDTSSTLELAAPAGRAVRVDGVRVGAGSLALRVMSGRHHLQVASASGSCERGAWVDAQPRARHEARAGGDGVVRVLAAGSSASDGSASAAPDDVELRAAARRLRRTQLERALTDSSRALHCMRSLEKRDLVAGAYVLFDVGVNPDGSKGHLNVVRSNVPADAERCLRAVVDEVELPRGAPATVRFKLAF